mmetsp:Transcript_59302/g.140006  ORF Transcript_59302/g.140006 Transcript_59302/m.140006 type:complete len:189 (+) Transcript_59302:658-1224(+)
MRPTDSRAHEERDCDSSPHGPRREAGGRLAGAAAGVGEAARAAAGSMGGRAGGRGEVVTSAREGTATGEEGVSWGRRERSGRWGGDTRCDVSARRGDKVGGEAGVARRSHGGNAAASSPGDRFPSDTSGAYRRLAEASDRREPRDGVGVACGGAWDGGVARAGRGVTRPAWPPGEGPGSNVATPAAGV